MSKVVAAVTVMGGAAATAVGGTYVMYKGSGVDEEGQKNSRDGNTNQLKTTITISDGLDFTDLSGFRGNKGGDCAKSFFPEVDYEDKGSSIDSSHSVSKDDLTATTQGANDPRSCLVINWEKSETSDSTGSSNKKWRGTFKWLWSFVNGDKGFVMFYTTKASNSDKQFDLEAGIYFLINESSKWNIKKHKEETGTSKNISKDSFDTSFPQNEESFDGLKEDQKTNWGFVKSGDDFENLCKDGDSDNVCPQDSQAKKTNLKEVWNWEVDASGGTSTPDKWNKTFTKNLEYLFGTDGFNMSYAFDTFKGSWKHQTSTGN